MSRRVIRVERVVTGVWTAKRSWHSRAWEKGLLVVLVEKVFRLRGGVMVVRGEFLSPRKIFPTFSARRRGLPMMLKARFVR